ncbi:MAG: hypothetical protein ACFNUM_06985 [Segatella salivae]
MKRVEKILMSGVINCTLDNTVQTDSSSVYMFIFHGEDELGKYILFGYVQTTNTKHNAVINGKSIHAFDVTMTDENYNKIEYLW